MIKKQKQKIIQEVVIQLVIKLKEDILLKKLFHLAK